MTSSSRKPNAPFVKKEHSASGAHAGRGFRYQDEYGTLLAIKHYAGLCSVRKIVPEGLDDFEVHTDDSVILIDTKSTAKDSRSRGANEDAKVFSNLWSKSEKIEEKPIEYHLVLNKGNKSYHSEDYKTTLSNTRLSDHVLFSKENPKYSNSFVIIEPAPITKAIEIFRDKHDVPPCIAEIICTKLKQKLGEFASSNTSKDRNKFRALTGSYISRIVGRMLSVCQITEVQALLLKGYIKYLDFLPAEVSPGFYLNVDVRPGHITSGQVVPMPKQVETAKELLISHRSCLVSGSSGSGKSALMWQIVHSTREDTCWFEVTNIEKLNDEELTLFLNARSEGERIGFVVDNVNSDRIELFEQLIGKTRSQENVWILGSIRTESLFSLSCQRTVPILKVEPDKEVARQIFVNLQKNKQTKVPFWVESWQKSDKLLLEYTYQLVEEKTLEETVTEQLRAKLRSAKSDDPILDREIAILKALIPISAADGKADVQFLKQSLNFKDYEFSVAIQRLNNEFVQLGEGGEEIYGLHSLRSLATCNALENLGLATRTELAQNALRFANFSSLEEVTYNIVYKNWMDERNLLSVIQERLSRSDQDFEIGMAFANGIRRARIQGITDEWCKRDLQSAKFPPIIAIPIAFYSFELNESPFPPRQHETASILNKALFKRVDNIKIPEAAASNLIECFCQDTTKLTPQQIASIFRYLYGVKLTTQQLEKLKEIELDFNAIEIYEAIQILDAVKSLSEDLYRYWITRTNQLSPEQRLANRLMNETPFALPIKYQKEGNCLLAKADIANPVLNDASIDIDLIRQKYSRSLLISDHKISCVRAGITDFSGKYTPPKEPIFAYCSEPTDTVFEISKKIATAIANSLGTETWSHYLHEETSKLQNLHGACYSVLNHLFRRSQTGHLTPRTVQRMQNAQDDIEQLVAPVDSYQKKTKSFCNLAPIHDLTQVLSFSLVRYIRDLPNSFQEFISKIDIARKAILDIREEPWHLTDNEPPEILSQIDQLLYKLELVAIESNRNHKNPLQMYRLPTSRSKKPFDYISEKCLKSFRLNIEKTEKSIQSKYQDCEIVTSSGGSSFANFNPIIVCLPMSSKADWKIWCQTPDYFTRGIQELIPEERQVIIIPVINNKSAIGYRYESMRQVMIKKFGLVNTKDNHYLLQPNENFGHHLPYSNLLSITIFQSFVEVLGLNDFIQKAFDASRDVSHEKSTFDIKKNKLVKELGEFERQIASVNNPELTKFLDYVECFLSGFDIEKIDIDKLDEQILEEGVAEIIWNSAFPDEKVVMKTQIWDS